jgi:hypothetical protein
VPGAVREPEPPAAPVAETPVPPFVPIISVEPGEYPPNYDVRECLKINTPQALLRDLHRTVGRFQVNLFDRMSVGFDRGGRAGSREIREAMRLDLRIFIKQLHDGSSELASLVGERKQLLGGDWTKVEKLGLPAETSELYPVFAPNIEDEFSSW